MKNKVNNNTRIAVFVSGGGTNLQALIDAQTSGIIRSGNIELVISNNPEAYALERAARADIPTAVVSKKYAARRRPLRRSLKKGLRSMISIL